MKLLKTRHIVPLVVAVLLLAATGCSTQKNTAKTRRWHAFKAKYNTYYNGKLAYIDGSLEKENGNKDNFTEMIPLYTVGNKANRETGKSNFDRAIEKCQKTIKLHSIKRRPVWNKRRRKTEKDIEWLSRREYNPFLWKAWMLMGRSQFHKGAFDEAASTFSYMSRLYQTQPAIYCKARAWLAKCYVEEGWLYDAEDVIRNMERDSIHWSARKEWDYTYADYYIHAGDYAKAIPYLRRVIKHEMRKKQRAREWYLMGQLYAALGDNAQATNAYRHVIRQNPPYELEFNARIAMTEVMSQSQSKKMISRLKRMAASDKNKEYLDQVYYALGNIYLNQKDTTQAIAAYERGNAKATRSGIEKGVLLLKLGDLYWEMERFSDARRCYGSAIGLLDKDRKDYAQLSQRSSVLDELVPFTDAIHLQDSLQALAKMDEKDRNAAIDRVIEELKKKEKEEKKKQAEQNAQETMAKNGGNTSMNTNARNSVTATQNANSKDNATWYFYNPLAVSQGKAAFQKQWGKRENIDDWQRVNKTVVAFEDAPELSEEQLDSIAQAEAALDSLEQQTDSAQNDPHRREYYMAQIPFTEEQVAASNEIIKDGLFNAGVIFKDKLNHLPLSEKHLLRLTDNYPDYEKMPDAYYHLFLLYSRKGEFATADSYVDKLKKDFPDNAWTVLLSDPYFKENAKFGVHIEDSLYAATYDAFKAARYGEVKGNVHVSDTRFPLGANREKFLFIGALSKLNEGDADGCLAGLKTVVEKYPQGKISEMAGMIVKGVQSGKRLRGGNFDLSNIWERRTAVLNDSDSINARQFSPERNADFVFMIAYKPDSVNENKMLFELARYNFTSYMVRNFDIEIEDASGLHRMLVKGFRNYDEALQYARQFHSQTALAQLIGKSRTIIISEQNLPLLGEQFSYDDYATFYAQHFAPLQISKMELLSEPGEITIERQKEEASPEDDFGDEEGGGNYINEGTEIMPEEEESTVVPDAETPSGIKESENVIAPEPEQPSTPTEQESQTTVVEPSPSVVEPSTNIEEQGGTTEIDNNVPVAASEEQQGETIISDEPEPETKGETIVTPQPEPETKAPQTVEPEPEAQQEETQQIVVEPEPEEKEGKTLEEEFYFDDDTPSTSYGNSGTDTIIIDTPSGQEDDDEYYDFDGF